MPLLKNVRRKPGHPPTGIRPGEKVSDYKRLTVRLPDDVRAELDAAAGALKCPQWRVLIDAIRAYVGSGPTLSDAERRVVRAVVRLHEKTET
jgi:hypothetical protein